MNETADTAAEKSIRGGRAYWVLLSLVLGLAIGAVAAKLGDGFREPALQASGIVGGLWLNALKMTVIPLVVALLVVGIARGAEAARGGRIAGRSVLWIVILCTASAVFGMVAGWVASAVLGVAGASVTTGRAAAGVIIAVSSRRGD